MTGEQALKKWEERTVDAGSKWKAGIAGKGEEYISGLRNAVEKYGTEMESHWQSGVAAVEPAEFQRAISGKGQKWLENLKASLA